MWERVEMRFKNLRPRATSLKDGRSYSAYIRGVGMLYGSGMLELVQLRLRYRLEMWRLVSV
jgi:hypothetical protein